MSKKFSQSHSRDNGVKVFKNPILNILGKTHISIPLIIFFGAGIILSVYAILNFQLSILAIFSYFIGGLLFFTLVEYLMHRFLYHVPSVYEEGKIAYALHGVHHEYPKDKKLLVMPPVLSVLLASIVLGICYLIFAENGFAFTGGFLFGYASYLSIHFIVHAFKPPKSFLKILWVHHSMHHYQDDERAFGVSSPLWDYVFGTMPKKRV